MPKLYYAIYALLYRCCAIHTMLSILCYLSCAIYAIYAVLSSSYYLCCVSLQRGRCYAIFPMLSLLCYLCYAIFALRSSLSLLCYLCSAIRIAKFNIWRVKCLEKEYMTDKRSSFEPWERRLLDAYRQGSLQQRLVEVKSQYQGDPMHRSSLSPWAMLQSMLSAIRQSMLRSVLRQSRRT